MAKTRTNALMLALDDTLVPAGFKRKVNSWYRRSDEVVEVVNLQASQWGPQFYLNYALWLRSLGEERFPLEYKCHIRMRIDDLVVSQQPLKRLLDLESGDADAERRTQFAALLATALLPFAENCQTTAGIRSLLKKGTMKRWRVVGGDEVWSTVGLSTPK